VTEALDQAWLHDLGSAAPDVVGAFRLYESAEFIRMRRAIRVSARTGTAPEILRQLDEVLDALAVALEDLTETAFDLPGGEADWTVAEAVGHALEARRQLTFAASLAASGRWPSEALLVVPSVPGPCGVGRVELLGQLEKSRRSVARAAAAIAGHEEDDCPLDHPLAGRMRCGEWLLFAGVHDLMHLQQLHRIQTELIRQMTHSASR
jgi:hypothetical protein